MNDWVTTIPSPPPRHPSHIVWSAAPIAILILACGAALAVGIRTTHDLDWPMERWDVCRDVAAAQTILDGQYGADPMYQGGKMWYNPLIPLVVAGMAKVTHQPLNVVYTRSAAYLDILVPIFFFVMVAFLFGRWVALAATIGFLFCVCNNDPCYGCATYSPWLYPFNFVQWLYYATFALLVVAVRTEKRGWFVALGLTSGVTLWGHVAPTFILMWLVAFVGIRALLRERAKGFPHPRFWRMFINIALVGLMALLVGLPFLYPLYAAYHFKILNAPTTYWQYDLLTVRNIGVFIKANLSWVNAVAAFGFFSLFKRKDQRLEFGLLLTWSLVCIIYILYGYLHQVMLHFHRSIPFLIPTFHFLIYLKAAVAVLFGYGLVALVQWAIEFAGRRIPAMQRPFADAAASKEFWPRAVLTLLALAIFAARMPAYLHRDDFVVGRQQAKAIEATTDELAATRWIREHTASSAVFLTPNPLGLWVVAPAGRKCVVVNMYFSNPYVDWTSRDRDRRQMYRDLEAGNLPAFKSLAAKYATTHVLTENEALPVLAHDLIYAHGRIRIYRVP